jgi:hypothetical protein
VATGGSRQARQQAALAAEERKQIELNRERVLYGWGGAGGAGEVYKVALITDPAELDTARKELATPKTPSQYVILRIDEHPAPIVNAGRARSLRQLIETSGLLSRAPEPGEYEVLRNAARELQNRASQDDRPGLLPIAEQSVGPACVFKPRRGR